MTRHRRGLMQGLLAALLLASSLPFAAPARARTLTVCASGCDYETIAAALEAAGDGDVISIGEGTFAGGVVVTKKVTLRGAGRDETTIRGPSDASVIRVGKRAKVTIEAVTITGGGGSNIGANAIGGGGILNEGDLVLADSVVRDNTVAASGNRARLGGGIYSDSTKPVRIRDSVIAGNRASGGGGGVYVRDGDVDIVGTTIVGNQGGSSGSGNGGGIHLAGSELMQIVDCTISDNQAHLGGGVFASAPLRVADSTISGNRAFGGGGISIKTNKLFKVEGSAIRENRATLGGGGISVLGAGGLALVDSTVENNESRNGGGIVTEDGELSVKDSTISGNTASESGGGIFNRFAEKIDLDNSQVIDNRAGTLGGGVFGSGRLQIRNGSVVSGNEPDQCVPVSCG